MLMYHFSMQLCVDAGNVGPARFRSRPLMSHYVRHKVECVLMDLT